LGALVLVVVFKTSSAIAHAYGIAVNLDMIITTMMIIFLAHEKWEWNIFKIIAVFTIFICVEFAFLGANIQKIMTGGWVPIVFATLCAFIIYTWNKGMEYLRSFFYTKKEDFTHKIKSLRNKGMYRLPEVTAVFITDVYDSSGGGFLNFLKLNRVVPDHVLVVSYHIENVPHVISDDRYEISCIDENICQLNLHYGFMDYISIPKALHTAARRAILPFEMDVEAVTYFIEAPNIIASPQKDTLWFYWQERLFSFLMRNYSSHMNIIFYQLPYDRTIAVGSYCVI
jgi:KUP system potassium uptake protein